LELVPLVNLKLKELFQVNGTNHRYEIIALAKLAILTITLVGAFSINSILRSSKSSDFI